ncbi:MAG: TetR/AcrR family transcriptional regulator [Acidimicrobiaceae bacterium]|nr:TetR/AcrR family transcriptional regulator [Acidimicrobiaceae bacterium]
MTEKVQTPTGLARRPQRLSGQATTDRMLKTAVAMLGNSGLAVSLEHVSLEEVIREAGVSRSAVYRRWPHKDLFFRDVVIELAKNATPEITYEEVGLLRQVVSEHEEWLRTPEGRTGLVAELIRKLVLLDFDTLCQSTAWRTYLTLNAAFLSISDDQTRDQVGAALTESELIHIATVASAWAMMTSLFGFRMRLSIDASFTTLASMLDASLRGMVLAALSDPTIVTRRVFAKPLGAIEEANWSLPALNCVTIAWGMLEPDPDVVWDTQRITMVRETLRALKVEDL